ncbi:MAG: hypothetical protein E7177_02895 [Erysipelotrichaceae bacterium]|nr:hypothetical protein [Erysipelotrichaceae bacterium]
MKPIMKKIMIPFLSLVLFCGGVLTSCNVSSNSSSSEIIENDEESQQKHIYDLAKRSGYQGTYEEWLESIKGDSIELIIKDNSIKWKYKNSSNWTELISLTELAGQNGIDGREVTFQVSEDHIQWKYVDDTSWTNLISINTLIGKDGADGKDGTDGEDGQEVMLQVKDGSIQWKYENEESWKVLIELSSLVGDKGETGDDGKQVSLQVLDGYIKWQYQGDGSWNNLVSLESLVGEKGENGKEVTFEVSEGFIKWKYVGEETWKNLIELSTLTGEKGKDGREVIIEIKDNYIVYRYNDETEYKELISLDSLVGEKGENGEKIIVEVIDESIKYKYESSDEWIDLITIEALKGKDGKNPIFQVNDGSLEWKYESDESWSKLVELSSLVVEKGEDGREVTFQVSENYIQWKYIGDESWNNLVSLDLLKGEKGESAYDIYLKYHPEYDGSEEQWINDLVNGLLNKDENVAEGLELSYVTGKGYRIIGYYGDNDELTFPTTYKGEPVFDYEGCNLQVSKLTIPEGYTTLKNCTMLGNADPSKLDTLYLPNSLEKIEDNPIMSLVDEIYYNGTLNEFLNIEYKSSLEYLHLDNILNRSNNFYVLDENNKWINVHEIEHLVIDEPIKYSASLKGLRNLKTVTFDCNQFGPLYLVGRPYISTQKLESKLKSIYITSNVDYLDLLYDEFTNSIYFEDNAIKQNISIDIAYEIQKEVSVEYGVSKEGFEVIKLLDIEDKYVVYDGNAHSIELPNDIPNVKIVASKENITEIGEYLITISALNENDEVILSFERELVIMDEELIAAPGYFSFEQSSENILTYYSAPTDQNYVLMPRYFFDGVKYQKIKCYHIGSFNTDRNYDSIFFDLPEEIVGTYQISSANNLSVNTLWLSKGLEYIDRCSGAEIEHLYFDFDINYWASEVGHIDSSILASANNVYFKDSNGHYLATESIGFEEGLEKIQPYSFTLMKNVNKVFLPSTIKEIGTFALNFDCDTLELYYAGTKEDFFNNVKNYNYQSTNLYCLNENNEYELVDIIETKFDIDSEYEKMINLADYDFYNAQYYIIPKDTKYITVNDPSVKICFEGSKEEWENIVFFQGQLTNVTFDYPYGNDFKLFVDALFVSMGDDNSVSEGFALDSEILFEGELIKFDWKLETEDTSNTVTLVNEDGIQKVVFTIPSDELEESIEFKLIPTITYKGLTRTIDQIYLNVEEGKDAFDYAYCKEYYDGYKTKIGIEDLNLTESPETKVVVLKAKDFSNTEEIDFTVSINNLCTEYDSIYFNANVDGDVLTISVPDGYFISKLEIEQYGTYDNFKFHKGADATGEEIAHTLTGNLLEVSPNVAQVTVSNPTEYICSLYFIKVSISKTEINLTSSKLLGFAGTSVAYGDGEATVDGVKMKYTQVSCYTNNDGTNNGLQMRNKTANGGVASSIETASAIESGIKSVKLTFAATKSTYDNEGMMKFEFSNNADFSEAETVLMNTVKGTKEYEVTASVATYKYVRITNNLGYATYWDSIIIDY